MQKTSEWLLSFNSTKPLPFQNSLKVNNEKSKRTVTISITGGKGGVGKTSISLKLGKELAKLGMKVLLLDCDYNLSNTAIKLGLPIKNTFIDLLTSTKNFDECLYKDGNFHLLSTCNGSLELFDGNFRFEQIVLDIINAHSEDYDFILLDCPAGICRESLTLNAYCDDRIFVVTPDKSSITDSYSLIKILNNRFGIKENHLLVNMYMHEKQYVKVVKSLSETIEHYIGSRTHILGGLKKIEVEHSVFDTFFLDNTESETHKSFIKVLGRYTDQLACGVNQFEVRQKSNHSTYEQEVQ